MSSPGAPRRPAAGAWPRRLALAALAVALLPAAGDPLLFEDEEFQELAPEERPRIYVYPLPECSFDTMDPEEFEDVTRRGISVMKLHRRIVESSYVVADPSEATLFYVPAPFWLWDNGFRCNSRFSGMGANDPFLQILEPRTFDGSGPARLDLSHSRAESPRWSLEGGRQRTVTLWIRMERQEDSDEPAALFASGQAAEGHAFDLVVERGCLRLFTCLLRDYAAAAPCEHRVDDGTWHHVAAAYNSSSAALFVDRWEVLMARLPLNTSSGPAWYGGPRPGGAGAGCRGPRAFRGEAKGLRLYAAALMDAYEITNSCGALYSPQSPCFQSVRLFVEASPWFQRKNGWDHFTMIYAAEYHVWFDAFTIGVDSDYALELAWPAFSRMIILHLGAIVKVIIVVIIVVVTIMGITYNHIYSSNNCNNSDINNVGARAELCLSRGIRKEGHMGSALMGSLQLFV